MTTVQQDQELVESDALVEEVDRESKEVKPPSRLFEEGVDKHGRKTLTYLPSGVVFVTLIEMNSLFS